MFKVVIEVDLKELPPFRGRHFSEHGVPAPIASNPCMPRSIKDFEQLLLFELEVKPGTLGNLEALWRSSLHGFGRLHLAWKEYSSRALNCFFRYRKVARNQVVGLTDANELQHF